jgi:uncharacterized protein
MLLGSPAVASSFDCAKASSPAERLVCSNPELSALDSRMSEAYSNAIGAVEPASKPRLVIEQRHWIRYVRDVCDTVNCLRSAYGQRSDLLEKNSRVIFNEASCDIPTGKTCRSVVTYRDSAARIDSFNQSLKRTGEASIVVGCDHLIDLPVGFKDSNHTFGAFCTLQKGGVRSRVKICNDDMNGHFAVDAIANGSADELRDFTDKRCYGG